MTAFLVILKNLMLRKLFGSTTYKVVGTCRVKLTLCL